MKLKEIKYKGFTIEVHYGDHMSDYFYCRAMHLSSDHNPKHINGGWESINIAVESIKKNIDNWSVTKINTIDDLANEINKALEYHEEYDATINVKILTTLLTRYKS